MMFPALAIFDLDNTLLECDSEALWSQFLYEKGLVDDDFRTRMRAYSLDYEMGRLDIHAYQDHLLRPLTELPAELLYAMRDLYLKIILTKVRPEIIQQVLRFREYGYTTMLVTATNDFLAEPIARSLHFPLLISTRIKMDRNQFTTRLDGIPAYREGKVDLLEIWLNEKGRSLEGSWAFSDSYNDLPLLSRVDHPVAVYPDANLYKHARLHGWEIVEPT